MPTKKTPKKTYTITEAAKKLGISRQAVHLAIKKGVLKARAKKVVEVVWIIPAGMDITGTTALYAGRISTSNWRGFALKPD